MIKPSSLSRLTASLLFCLPVALWAAAAPKPPDPNEQYVLGPDSLAQPEVPKGEYFEFKFAGSRIFPGTERTIGVYVPAEYTGERPACVYVSLDGFAATSRVAFDNLIYKKEMPVTIAVGVSPGVVPSADGKANPRLDRSFEFDSLSDRLVRLVLEEVLPEVQKHRTKAGLPIRLSEDPNDRGAGGGSTGAIAAFTLAWQRPEAFRRVSTAVGTFVGMRGGDRYAVLVRKTEPKPIRIFMQDGSNDEWMGGPEVGDWWMSNQTMERALTFAGYAVAHVWGEGTHNGRHAAAVFPDAMRWIWKDWPAPVTAGTSQNLFLQAIVQPGETWQPVPGNYQADTVLAADQQGDVLFKDAAARKTWRISGHAAPAEVRGWDAAYAGLACGPDGRWYATQPDRNRIVSVDTKGKTETIARGIHGSYLTVSHQGVLYVTEPGDAASGGRVWLVTPDGKKTQLDEGLHGAAGVVCSSDGLWLSVAESQSHWGYSYRVQPDGTTQMKERFYWFHVADTDEEAGTGGWCQDRDGRLYAATRLGVQVLDRNGRTRAILPVPGGQVTAIAFGGPGFGTLYVVAGGKIFQRTMKVPGVAPAPAPAPLPPWGAG